MTDNHFIHPDNDVTDQSAIDNLSADILASIRTRTANPAEGFYILELVFFLLWSEVGTDPTPKEILTEFVGNVLILHATNEIKGTA